MAGRSRARLRISRNGSVVLAHVARAASRCARINVHIPKLGYVAIGETLAEGEQFDTLKVRLDGERARLADLALLANYQLGELGEPVTESAAEYVVPVRWILAHPKAQ